jgi:hypothetical protein
MYKALLITSTAPKGDFVVHQFRNFGERVYLALRAEYEVSIAEIDASTDHFFVRQIHKREARTVAKLVRQIAEKEKMLEIIEVTEIENEK